MGYDRGDSFILMYNECIVQMYSIECNSANTFNLEGIGNIVFSVSHNFSSTTIRRTAVPRDWRLSSN